MRNWMNVATAATAVTVIIGSAPASGQTILKAEGDNRAGTIVTDTVGGLDPIEAGYNVNPGENDFDPITFNQQVQVNCGTGQARASLNSSSNWIGYNQNGGTFTKFTINSTADARTQWGPSTCNGFANADDNFNIPFRPIAPGNNFTPTVLRFKGSVATTGVGTGFVGLRRNGNLIYSADAGAFDRVIEVTPNADYVLEAFVEVNTSAFGASNVVGTATITAEIELISLHVGDEFVNPANDHVYYLTNDYPWLTADTYSKSFGGYLAQVNDAAENQWILNTFSSFANPDANLWIGLTDQAVEGQHRWTSGEPVTFTNWNPGEPNNDGNEDFVEFYINTPGTFPGRWNDAVNAGSPIRQNFALIEIPVGDMNCDNFVTVGDIGAFVLAITDDETYRLQNPNCNAGRADINRDLFVSLADIGAFVNLLTGL